MYVKYSLLTRSFRGFVHTNGVSVRGGERFQSERSGGRFEARSRLVGFGHADTVTLRPSLEIGVRHDGGGAESGAGVEVGGPCGLRRDDLGAVGRRRRRARLPHRLAVDLGVPGDPASRSASMPLVAYCVPAVVVAGTVQP